MQVYFSVKFGVNWNARYIDVLEVTDKFVGIDLVIPYNIQKHITKVSIALSSLLN